jgi:two-component SAPR family response regulator
MRNTAVFIDNDVAELQSLETALKEIDPSYFCISFIFGDEAVRVVKDELKVCPKYIFLNINLRRRTGADCLQELRQIKQAGNFKIVIVSAVMPGTVAGAFLDQGADFAFQLPTTKPGFKQMMEEVLLLDPI